MGHWFALAYRNIGPASLRLLNDFCCGSAMLHVDISVCICDLHQYGHLVNNSDSLCFLFCFFFCCFFFQFKIENR